MPKPQSAPYLRIDQLGGVAVARFTCDSITDDNVIADIGKQLKAEVERTEHPRILLDFSGVSFFASSLLARVVRLYQKVKAAGGRVALCSLTPHLRDVFHSTRLDQMLDICGDEAEALGHLRAGPGA